MPRSLVTITSSYVAISAVKATFTIKKVGEGTLYINDTDANDDTAEQFSKLDFQRGASNQVIQWNNATTYVRSSGTGWQLIIDEGV